MSKNSAAVEKCDKRMGGYSQEQRNNLDDHYTERVVSTKDKALQAIAVYLKENGWKCLGLNVTEYNHFQYVDPVTEISHRLDFAFIVQTERDIYEGQARMKEHTKKNKEMNISLLKADTIGN